MWLDGRDCRARTLLEAWLVLGAATREHDNLQAWPHTTQKNMLPVAPTKTHGVYGGSAVDHVLLCVCVLSHKPLSREEKTETDQARRMQAVPGLRRIKAFGNVCFSVSYCKACFLGSLQTNVTTMDSMFHLL